MAHSSDSKMAKPHLDRRTVLKLGGGLMVGAAIGKASAQGNPPQPRPLPHDEYAKYDGLGLADLVRKGQVTAEELLEAAVARAEAVNPKINAIVLKLYDIARKEIARGLPSGPFTGVPFLVKDLGFWMKGVVCSEGSRLFKDHIPARDDTVVKRYRKAGLIIFGRTHSPESGLTAVTESVLHGITRNPWNFQRTAGGSSGGTAAAIAAGIVPMGSGGDGGGSIRIPSSCCGLFGLKPTRARVPFGPDIFECWGGLAVCHAITRSVRDSAALLDATAGPELGDAYWAPPPARPFLQEVGVPPAKLRMAMTFAVAPDVPIDPECRKAAENAARLCESLGHCVEEVSERFSRVFPTAELGKALGIIVEAETAAWVRGRLEVLKRELRDDDLERATRTTMERAKLYTADELALARANILRSSRIMAKFQRKYDVILTPTLGKPPIPHGELSLSRKHEDVVRELGPFIPFTPLANWTGQPAMSVPLHWSPAGLPVGVHFFGRFGDEATLFRLAGQLEEARPWADKRPPI